VSDASSQEQLVKSKQRVSDHGEVFTPAWLVDAMLDLVKLESERIDSRFLEPACGSGNFLKQILKRKLATVQSRYGKSEFERRHYALFGLMCIYGIELLEDNVKECRESLLVIFAEYLQIENENDWYQAARTVLRSNIMHGDALTLSTTDGKPIEFPEWGYLGAGKYQRRDFRYQDLALRSSFEGTLFEMLEEHELFIPTRAYESMTMEEIAK
jgi:hypothetical protein